MKNTYWMHSRIVPVFIYRLILMLTAFLPVTPASGQDAFITKYDAYRRSQRCFTVTEEDNNQFGAVWWVDKVDFQSDTAFNFVVYMGDRDGNGADGLAFVMHTDPRDTLDDPTAYIGKRQNAAGQTVDMYQEGATGDAGGGLGMAIHNSAPVWNQRIWPAVAVEIDTWNNRDVQDGRSGSDCTGKNLPQSPYYGWDHTAVVYNGDLYCQQQIITDGKGNTGRILPIKPSYAYGTGNNPDGSPYHNIEDNRCYMFQIRWIVNPDGTQTLQLWGDVYNGSANLSGLELIMTHTDDMLGTVFNGQSVLRFGFTGSTGGSINEQTVCLLGENLKPIAVDDYATIPLNTGAIVDITANDNDPDGDHLSIPTLVIPPRNGIASIFDSHGTDMLRYIPNVNYTGPDSLAYATCDVNSTKCYAKCDTAWVYLDITCIPWQIGARQIKPNEKCIASTPDNGAAEAYPINPPFPGPIWFENFENLPDGTTVDNGETAWSVSTSGACKPGNVIEAQNGKFRIKKTGCEVIWTSEEIDISPYSDVAVSFDLWSSGMVDQNDYVKAFYILDGGAEVPFDNGVFTGRFDTAVKASTSNLNGSTLRIVIRSKTSDQGGGEENYFFDNILVLGIGAPPLLEYTWYAGPVVGDTAIRQGETATGLAHGLYTIIALEPLTGCYSDPVTVQIDSTGSRVQGGYVRQIASLNTCEPPFNGALLAGVYNGQDSVTLGYTFEWYYRESPRIGLPIRIGALAEQLEGREYAVVITDNSTGCDTLINDVVPIDVVIPNLQASVLSDIIDCLDPLSGAAEANVNGITSGYRFEWYLGTAIQARPPDFSGDTIRTLPAGEITVQAVDIATNCASDPVILQITENLVYPDPLAFVLSKQTSCDSSVYTGSLDAAVDLGGIPTTSGYEFMWFKGPNDILPARTGYTGGHLVDGLESGPYRLRVTNPLTRCSSILDTVLQDLRVSPVLLAVNTSPVSSCALPPNGRIEIMPDGPLPDFSYQVYSGWGLLPANLIYDGPGNVIGQLPAGDYTATVTNLASGCVSDPEFVQIGDATLVPTASIASTPQISCDPLFPTGTLQATPASGSVAEYGFEWFYGHAGGTPVGSVSGAGGETALQLDSGRYVLRLTHLATSCVRELYAQVPYQVQPPVLDPLIPTPSDGCNSMVNGQLQASADGGQTDPVRYRFTWEYLETPEILTDTTASLSGLLPGRYRVTVFDRVTRCPSLPTQAVIADEAILPDPEMSATASTSCLPGIGNGQIRVTTLRNGSANLADYQYTWFRNNTSGSPLGLPDHSFPFAPDSSAIAGLDSGLYALRIVNRMSSCASVVYVPVQQLGYVPTIDSILATDAIACSAPFLSGIEIIAVSGGVAQPDQYTYEWTDLQAGSPMPQTIYRVKDSLATDYPLPAGRYRVRAFNEFNCPSDFYEAEIADRSSAPTLALAVADNSSCLPALFPNGRISATVDTTGYRLNDFDFTWHSFSAGGNVDPSNIQAAASGELAASLQEGNYRVSVINQVTRCSSEELAILAHKADLVPLIDTTYTSPLTVCTSPNAEIGLKVIPVQTLPPQNTANRQYQFYLQYGTALTDTTAALRALSNPAGAQPDTAAFRSLNSGFWSAAVLDMYSHCLSPAITVGIDRAPDLNIEIINKTAVSTCGTSNGLIEVRAGSDHNRETPPPGPGFDFQWYYHGTGSADPGLPLAAIHNGNETDFRSEKIGLLSGFFTIAVFDRATGCEDSIMTNLESQEVPLALITHFVPSDQCDPGNGRIEFEIHAEIGSNAIEDYLIHLFEGPEIDESRILASIKPAVGTPYPYANQFSTIGTGTYTVAIKEDFGTNECYSDKSTGEIIYSGPVPDLQPVTLSEDFSCAGAAGGTGQLSEVNLALPGYEFIWYAGTDTTSAGLTVHGAADQSDPASWIADNPQTGDNLFAGVYTLVARDRVGPGLGCVYIGRHVLPGAKKAIEIVQAPITDKTHCSIDNGTAGVFSVRENGGAEIRVDTSDYQYFELLNSGFSVLQHTTAGPAPVLGTAAQPFAGLSPGAFYLVAMDTRTRCLSQPKNVGIGQATSNPLVVISQLSPDFNCTGAHPTGALLAEVNGDTLAASYEIRWHFGTDTSQASVDTYFLASGLSAPPAGQLYAAVVTDRDASDGNLGCQSIVQSLLRFSPTEVSIPATELLIDPITTCALPPDGFATVLNIREDYLNGTVTATGPSYAARYELQLLDERYAPIDPLMHPFATSDAVSGMFNHVPEGFYYVRARNLITGCDFGPGTRFEMANTSAAPALQISALQADFSCAGGTPTGMAQLSSVTGGSDGDSNHTHFSYAWIQEANGAPVAPDGSLVPSGASQLLAGSYTVTVTDLNGPDSLCAAEISVEIPRLHRDFLIVQAQAEPQYVCYPDGTAQAVSLQLGGAAISLPDSLYSILLFDSQLQEIGSATAGSGLPTDPFSGLAPGRFFLQAVDRSTQCSTAPYAVLVEDLSQNPVIATTLLSPQYSLNPDPATWTGMLSASGSEAGGHRFPQGYQYQWYAGTGTTGPMISTDTVMWGLDEGYFTLEVTSDSTQCVSRQTAFVPFVYLRPSFDPVPSPQTLCLPADGSLFIPEIYLEGILDTLSEYTFRAYHGQFHTGTPDSVFAGVDAGNAYAHLSQGGYYFVARENDWWVESYPVRAEIENHAPYPVLLYDADNSLNQTSCDPSVAANGAVAITATEENGLPGVYHYTWYDPTGQRMDSTSRRVSGLPAGIYRVEVANTLTGCVSSALLPIGDHPVIPSATASTEPLTNCDLSRANGAVSGFVVNALSAFGQDSDYIFNWYTGNSVKAAADHSGQVWTGLTDGIYTLQTIDRLNTTCVSSPVTVVVARQTVNPLLNVNEISPLTNCDPAKVNAVFEATADGGVTGFSFEWKDASGVVVSSSPRAINLGNQTYTVMAMNTVTGCWSEIPLNPSVSLDIVPAPLVDVLSGRTSCLEPDGRASASVQGDMAGYIFRFYPAGSDFPLGNIYSGTVLQDLDTGSYYVTAESRASGCISAPTPFRIHDATYFPEFLLVAQPSSCDEPTGSAEVVIGDLNRPHKINWYDSYGYVGGEEYMNFLPVGRFTVEVEGTDGCMTVHEVEVTGDITVYNGVSVNGDGLNDYFQVKCLEFFPDNKVRIFNRAGNLVYEMDYYDMHDPNRRFDGESNRGMNIGGTSLPEGTYYYIVDKMDGSEPKVGYLELKR